MSDRTLPGIQPSENKKPRLWPWLLALGVVILYFVITAAINAGDDSDYDSNTSYEAIAQCEAAIKDKLKAPSTADFSSTATGSGTWTVVGTVDAENSFGAKVRTSYQCSVIIDNEKDTARVRIDSLE